MLSGPRLILRQMGEHDLPDLYAILSDPLVMRHWSHPPLASPADAAWYFANLEAGRRLRTFWQWGVVVRDEDAVIGTVSLFAVDAARRRAELGYAIASARWRRGHASEAVRLAIAHASGALGLRTLLADVDPRNAASCRLLDRLGFHCTEQRHTGRCVDGVPVPSALYVLQTHMPDRPR
ncbi:MAG TPA: GNAT family N-acetyltransferase [Dokdonella sp.]|uniref:GNAT family N-acetyltransferase n=1 Tax=Dokdonella sp. TaxID=2291710 RepID=UPI002C010C7E|nr:GNAT family N-acetyltransferase [Dokdonella sp.]HUD42134.1 GNAT family N-acetyltransferase [Dokdonella sp.]